MPLAFLTIWGTYLSALRTIYSILIKDDVRICSFIKSFQVNFELTYPKHHIVLNKHILS